MNPENSDSDDEGYDNNFYFEPAREDPQKPKRFQYTSASILDKTNLIRSSDFEAFPPVLHFPGFIVGNEYSLVVHIINCSSNKKRMNILPLNSKTFKVLPVHVHINFQFHKYFLRFIRPVVGLHSIWKPSSWPVTKSGRKIQADRVQVLIRMHSNPRKR